MWYILLMINNKQNVPHFDITVKTERLLILVTERWDLSRSRCTGSQPAGD